MLLTEARFIKPAELEFEEAFDHYADERPGLGQQFADCVEATILQAMHFPEAGAQVVHSRLRRTVRRFQVYQPFPYDLVATVIDAELVVIAIAHHKRRPTYWIKRIAGRTLPK
jgi:plasmid stabilization system protein ParE